MVAHQTTKRSPITNGFSGKFIFLGLLFCLTATIVLVTIYALKEFADPVCPHSEDETSVQPEPEVEPEKPVLPNKIDFQPIVDQFVNSTTGNRSVIVYDIKRDEMAGQYNIAENYNTASLYKLFVVYEGYRRIENGSWDANAPVGYTGKSVLECLDLAIRESYSPCAEPLWNMIGHGELDSIISNDYGITGSVISGLQSNPNDILAIMKRFYEHPDFSREDLVLKMKDSFLNQPPTTYNWRQGLPSGFSRANVYNKVGWDYNPSGNYWNIYHDAAIVEFPEQDRHFIVIVMTNRVPFQKIKEFGSNLEALYYQTL